MKPLLFVRADPSETFGVAPSAVASGGAEIRIWEAISSEPAPDLAEHSGVVVFGSTYNVEHADEQPFIKEVGALTREAVGAKLPVLGSCFGAQILAWSLGARVEKSDVREVGFEPIRPLAPAASDVLTSHLSDGDPEFQWHMDTFELPEGAVLLVRGDAVENQAFRFGDRAWGIQFHFEIDSAEIELWLDEYAREGDLLAEWGKTTDQVRDERDRYIAGHERRGTQIFRRFVEVCQEAEA